MYFTKQTNIFSQWLNKLKDIKGKVAILRRVDRMKYGNFGDFKYLGDGVSELRISFGPGYRIYYTKQESQVIILLVGGDKSSQNSDIIKAKKILEEFKNEQSRIK